MSRRTSPDRGLYGNGGRKFKSVDRTFSTSSTDVGHQLDNLEEEDEEDDIPEGSSGRMLNPGREHVLRKFMTPAEDESVVVRKLSKGNSPFPPGYNKTRRSDNIDCDSSEDMHIQPSSRNPNENHRTSSNDNSSRTYNDNGTHFLEDEFSVDLPSDLPSGYVDIEANLVGTIRLGQEEDDDEELMMMTKDHDFSGDFEVRTTGNPGSGGGGSGSSSNRRPVPANSQDEKSRQRKLSVISNGRVFTHGRGYHLHNHCHRHQGVGRDNSTSAQSNSSTSTITQHYYPEGGWGYIVLITAVLSHVLMCGLNLCAGLMIWAIINKFGSEVKSEAGWLGACSVGVSLFLSPIWVSICKRKSTRLAAVFGGLVASLGCLFTSFATQLHQVFFSYSTILGVGVGLTRDASSLMVGQYFKRKRDLVEIIVVAASGLGILVMSILINNAIDSLGWRLGLQAVTGTIFFCFFLGTCYRSASLYHPQRRAILHLKNQKRKVKEKEKRDDGPPFLDCSCLRSKTVQILLLSSAFIAFGIYSPIFYVAIDYNENLEEMQDLSLSLMYIYVGVAWMLGCLICGILIVQKSKDCRVSKQYLCQVSGIICGISIVTFTIVKGQSGLIIFCCIYGFSLGGYNYSLKIYTYERVRARHFPRAWSFIQSSQALPMFLGVPFTGYLNDMFPGWRSGYYLSAASVFLGSGFLFLTNVRRRRLSRRKSQNSSVKTCETTEKSSSPKLRRLSFAFPVEQMSAESKHEPICDVNVNQDVQDGLDASVLVKELTCISEEAIADMDFQDIYYEEWEDFFDGECITSCNKVENCLASEFPTATPRPLLPSAVKRLKKRPGLQAGLVGTAAAVAHGVASVGSRLPLTIHEHEDDHQAEPDRLDVQVHNSRSLQDPQLIPTNGAGTGSSSSNNDSCV